MLHLKRILLLALFVPSFGQSQEADIQAGKALFNTNCAACHQLNRKAVGPALRGVSEKYDREWLYKWIKNGTQMIKKFSNNGFLKLEFFNILSDNIINLMNSSNLFL